MLKNTWQNLCFFLRAFFIGFFLCLLFSAFFVVSFLFYTIFHNCTRIFLGWGVFLKHFSDIHNLFASLSVILQSISDRVSLDTCVCGKRALAWYYISFPKSPYGIHIHGQFAVSCGGGGKGWLVHISSHFHRQQQTLPFSILSYFSSSCAVLPRILWRYETTKNADSFEPKTETEIDSVPKEAGK